MKLLTLALGMGTLVIGLSGTIGYGVSGIGSLDTQDPSLALIAPNGGEYWLAGYQEEILWYAGDSNLGEACVLLSYCLNDSLVFIPINGPLDNTLTHLWQVPVTLTSSARIRIQVTDTYGNQNQRISLEPFTIGDSGLAVPQNPVIARNGSTNIQLSWDPVTEYLDGTPVTPTGYLILHGTAPCQDIDDFLIIGGTSGLSYVHHGCLSATDIGFYCIVAYLDDFLVVQNCLACQGSITLKDLCRAVSLVKGGEK
jgi:hypothetical protein